MKTESLGELADRMLMGERAVTKVNLSLIRATEWRGMSMERE
jgi:hypothetical protein